MKMKIFLILIMLSSSSEAGLLKWLKELFTQKTHTVTTQTVTGKTLNYTLTGKVASTILLAHGLSALPSYASEVYTELKEAKDNGYTSYSPKVCPSSNGNGLVVVPHNATSCLDGSKPKYGRDINLRP